MGTPFHEGEIAVQIRAGARDEAERLAAGVLDRLLPPVQRALSRFRLAAAASLDADGQPWASLLAAEPGFLRAVDDRLLLVDAAAGVSLDDTLRRNLLLRPELGLLALDLAAARRLRLNGRALIHDRGIFLSVAQAYANCPRYIRRRTLERSGLAPAVTRAERRTSLSPSQQQLVRDAETFFVASAQPGGLADASHRGGPPGFVEVQDPTTLVFEDYPGNNMFNTLGNLTLEPRAGLLFPDFERGDTLQLAGRAGIEWTRDSGSPRPRAVVRYRIEQVVEVRGAGVVGRALDAGRDGS
jgi:predicted pyridoxine 5'-phosphate oxidase superfamily flavin-nucleotide-binding protein